MTQKVIDLREYKPLPSQKYLHDSKAKHKLYVGTFGSGKTKWLIYEALMLSLEYAGNYGIVLRNTYPELDDTILHDFLEEIPDEMVIKWEKTKKRLTLFNGSQIVFRAFDRIKKIKSLNLGWFAIDQIEEVDEKKYLALASRLRLIPKGMTKHDKMLRCGLGACNYKPNNWTLRRWLKEKKDSDNYDYVVAQTKENTHLPDGYIEELRETYPDSWFDRYVQFDLSKLQEEFDNKVLKFKEKQYINSADVPYILDEKYDENSKFVITIDAGVGAPTAVLFTVVDLKDYFEKDDGLAKVYCFSEIYEKNLSVEQVSFLIKARMRRYNLFRHDTRKVWKFLIDPSTKRKQQNKRSIESVYKMYHDFGIPVQQAINDKEYGILKMMQLVEKGLVLVCNDMEYFRTEAEEYHFDVPDSVDDIDSDEFVVPDLPNKKQRDHLIDCLRYTIAALPSYWFSLTMKHKDIKSKKILEKRCKHRVKRTFDTKTKRKSGFKAIGAFRKNALTFQKERSIL